jgi:ribosome-associated protein
VAATAAGKTKIASPKAGAKRPSRATTPDKQSLIREAALLAAQYAIEKKATEVRLLDLGAITSMTDFFVIASGDSDRQVKAIAEGVITGMRDKEGMSPWRSEGWDSLKWIIIDFVDFVVHVFQSESRAVYNLERLWGDAPTITIEDTMTPAKPTGTRKKAAQTKAIPAVRVISAFKEVGGTKR